MKLKRFRQALIGCTHTDGKITYVSWDDEYQKSDKDRIDTDFVDGRRYWLRNRPFRGKMLLCTSTSRYNNPYLSPIAGDLYDLTSPAVEVLIEITTQHLLAALHSPHTTTTVRQDSRITIDGVWAFNKSASRWKIFEVSDD